MLLKLAFPLMFIFLGATSLGLGIETLYSGEVAKFLGVNLVGWWRSGVAEIGATQVALGISLLVTAVISAMFKDEM